MTLPVKFCLYRGIFKNGGLRGLLLCCANMQNFYRSIEEQTTLIKPY